MKIREWAATALLLTSAFTLPACGGGTDGDGGAGASELAVTQRGADARIDPAMVGTFHYEPLGAPSTPPHILLRPNPLFKSDETREEQLGKIQLKADGT
ncbi:MAG: hypothetical protein JWP87_567, partial [Labilithrix sp.]|nr:hypothetical protein [Labilithrix sp.]